MKRATLVESTVFFALGAVGIVEGVRLSKASTGLNQALGPGIYILVLSILLIVLGAGNLLMTRRKLHRAAVPATRAQQARTARLVGLLCANVFLIQLIGYFLASALFFVGVFKVLQIKSWLLNIVLSLTFASFFYLLFVKFCSVIFPAGMLFD